MNNRQASEEFQTCEACGHIRYETDLHDGRCDVCELWAEDQIRSLRAEVARLTAELSRYTGPLTDEQANKVMPVDMAYLKRRDLPALDAAIRAAREGVR